MVAVRTGQTMSNCQRFWFVWHCWVVDILDRFQINSTHFLPTSKRAIDASKMPSRGPIRSWRFRVSLRQLIGKIDVSDPHFVRCIKPNPEKAGVLPCIDVPWSKCCFIHHEAPCGCHLLHKEFTRSDLIEQRCRTSSIRHWLEAQRFFFMSCSQWCFTNLYLRHVVTRFEKWPCALQTSRDSWWFRRLWLFHIIYNFLYLGIFQAYPRYIYP